MIEVVRWDEPADIEVPFDGAERRVLANNDRLMLVHNAISAGNEYPAHTHDETVQGVFVVEGEIEVFGDERIELETGDSAVIPPGIHHGFRGVAPRSRLFVAFTPPVGVTPSDLEG